MHCVVADLGIGEGYDDLPAEADYVLELRRRQDQGQRRRHHGQRRVGRPADDALQDSQGVPALLVDGGVRARDGAGLPETDPLGDNNHTQMMPNYVLSKVAAEAVARTYARTLDLPTIITRLNVPYGDNGGWPWYHLLMMAGGMAIPVPPDGGAYHLIHEDDIIRTLPALLDGGRSARR